MAKRSVDLDALVEAESLDLKLGGESYEFKDAPVSFLVELRAAADGDRQLDPAEIVRTLLGPLGFNEEREAKVGLRQMVRAASVLMGFLTGTLEELGLPRVPTVEAETPLAASTGPESSPGSAEPIPPTA